MPKQGQYRWSQSVLMSFKLNIRKPTLFYMTDETGRHSILHDTWNTSQTLFQAPTLTLRSSLLKETLGANR